MAGESAEDPGEEYRHHLILAEQKAQEDYDKTIVALAGGGLGVSLLFIEKVVGTGKVVLLWALGCGWTSWALSIVAVLASYFFSRMALRTAIAEWDEDKSAMPRQPGGRMARLTERLNVLSGLLLVLGVVLVCAFAIANLGGRHG